MGAVWRFMLRDLRTQDWKIWLLVPVPLLLFVGLLSARLETSPHAIAIALTAFFIMQANLHRQTARKEGHGSAGLPAAGREALLAKYAMAIVWFMLAAIVCNAARIAYALYQGDGFRLSGPEELAGALAALLAAAGISLPLHCWLRERASTLISFLFVVSVWCASDIARAVPDALVRTPLLPLAAGAAVFALSWWPAYRGFRRTR